MGSQIMIQIKRYINRMPFYRRDRTSLNYSISILLFEEKCSKMNAMREKKECAIVLSIDVE